MASASDKRPVYLNLLQVNMPVGAVASILHRITGLLLVLLIPVVIYLFQRSLEGAEGFAEVVALFRRPLVMAAGWLALWALMHHLLVGIRFLLIDTGLIQDLQATRASAWIANAAAPVLAALLVWGW